MKPRPDQVFESKTHRKIKAAVWLSDKGGMIRLEKSYKRKDTGEWLKTNSYFANEVPAVIEVMQQAKDFCEGNTVPTQESSSSARSEDVPDVIDY